MSLYATLAPSQPRNHHAIDRTSPHKIPQERNSCPRHSRAVSRVAYYRKTKTGWRVEIERRGVRMSRSFTTKGAAQAWASREETAIIDGKADRWPRKTLADALARYLSEVTTTKQAQKLEHQAVGMMLKEHPALCEKILHTISPADCAAWRDAMLRRVSGSTVQRYINFLRHVWTVASKEWAWCGSSPWAFVRMPAHNPPRDRLIGWREARAIIRRCHFRTGLRPFSKLEQVAWVFLLALRTGMRPSELLGLTGETVDLTARVVTLAHHKTHHLTRKPRYVPLTSKAHRLLSVLWKPGPLFDIAPASLDALFRKAANQAMVKGLKFYDARATALTHLARKVDVMTLARISGHLNINQLFEAYYRETAADISARMG